MLDMNYINLSHQNDVKQVQYKYCKETDTIIFNEDIKIGEWIIGRIIKLCGPKSSIYKYDFNCYLEFVITDKNDITNVIQWHYNDDKNANVFQMNFDIIQTIQFFVQKYPIFDCTDWQDYKAFSIVADVRDIVNYNISNSEKLSELKRLICKI